MLNNTTIKYSRTESGEKFHIVKQHQQYGQVSSCGLLTKVNTPSLYNPMRADICKTCSKIHNKQES